MGHPADFPPSFPLRIALTYPFLSTTRGQRGKEKLIIVTSSRFKRLYLVKETPAKI